MNKRALANCGSAKFTAVQLQSSKAKSIDTMNSAHWKPFAILLMLIEMCDVCVPAKCGTYTYLTWLNWRDSRTRRACKQSRDAFFSLTKFSYYFAFYNDAIDRTRDKFQNWNLVYFSCLSKKVFSFSLLFPLCMRNRFWWHTLMDAKKVITINTITKNRKKLHLKF